MSVSRAACLFLAILSGFPACMPSGGEDDTGDTQDTGPQDAPQANAVVTTTDYAVGSLAVASLDGWIVTDEIAPTSGDPYVETAGGYAFQFNGYMADFVRTYAVGSWEAPIAEFSVGTGNNPHDVALAGGDLWVTLYEIASIRRYDPESGDERGTLDLSALADSDGIPEADDLQMAGETLLVSLQQLDRNASWVPVGGVVAAIDPQSKTLGASWAVGPNPTLWPNPAEPGTAVVLTGSYTWDGPTLVPSLDGGLRVLDPTEAGPRALVLEESDLGAHVTGYAGTPSGAAILVTDNGDATYSVRCFDLGSRETAVAWTTGDWLAAVAANDRGEAWIAVRSWTGESGIVVWDIDACASLTGEETIGTSLPPFSIAFY